MMQIRKIDSLDQLAELKHQYIRCATAPLDGMWLYGFVPMATHFGFYDGDKLAGFFCVNEEGYLLQFFVDDGHQNESTQLFESILQDNDSVTIVGAFVSTAEPGYLSHCLDQFTNFKVNALMYQHDRETTPQSNDHSVSLVLLESPQLSEAVDFAVDSIGAPAEWLNGYYGNLIERKELFGVRENSRLIATGESRRRDEYQTEYADVGMIVAKPERGRGLATQILDQLVALNDANGLKSICSTEKSNIAAQKSIVRAGFVATNRIIRFHA